MNFSIVLFLIFKQNKKQFVDKYGINKCIEMAMDHIDPKNNRDYHISFDIDALDRREAPSTGYSRMYNTFNCIFVEAIHFNSFFNYSSWWFDAAWRRYHNWKSVRKWPPLWFRFGGNLSEFWWCSRSKNDHRFGHSVDKRSCRKQT